MGVIGYTTDMPLLELAAQLWGTKLKFIIDNGAVISVLPMFLVNGINLNPTLISVSSASGEKIKCQGHESGDWNSLFK